MQIFDSEINYICEGEGADIVILHGWGANIDVMRSISKHLSNSNRLSNSNTLSQKYKVYTLDLPGFGKSSEPKYAWGVPEYAKFVIEFCKELSIEKPILIGHSFGASIMIEMMSNLSFEADKAVIIGGAGIKSQPSEAAIRKGKKLKAAKEVAKFLPFGIGDKVVSNMKEKMGSADYKAAKGVMRDILVKRVNYDQTEFLEKISVPTLLIWGENDSATPLKDGQTMEKLMQNAGLAVIQNAGHFSFLDKPQHFFAILDSYL